MQRLDPVNVSFTRAGAWAGAKKSIPTAIGAFTYGLVFGVLTRQSGMSLVEALLMSSLVFAGSSQFAALGLWIAPLPVLPIIITTFIVNLRHLLMGAALRPWFSSLGKFKKYGTLFLMNDESWALTMSYLTGGGKDAAFLLGSGLLMFGAWTGSTVTGRLLGNVLDDPAKWGLDFAFTAVFIALLAGLWKGKSSLVPWIVAAIVAVAAAFWLPGKWYIVLGGLAGSLAGAFRNDD